MATDGGPANLDWRYHGVRVIPSSALDPNTAQTPGMNRFAAITHARTGAEKLWAGTVDIIPTPRPAPIITARSKA